jgi:hypothetical protein
MVENVLLIALHGASFLNPHNWNCGEKLRSRRAVDHLDWLKLGLIDQVASLLTHVSSRLVAVLPLARCREPPILNGLL